MNNREILRHIQHRPFPLPGGFWVMKQVWNDLLFLHWPADEAELLPYLPQGVELEYYEGRPWVSMSPFILDPLTLRGTPPLPFAGRFLELNLRTYVSRNGIPGICFLTLEASSRLAVAGARIFAHLPYQYALMKAVRHVDGIHYNSERRRFGREAAFSALYEAAGSTVFHAEPGTLVHWLIERYCLYAADRKGNLYRGDIHHLPWPLQNAKVRLETNTLAQSYGLCLSAEPAVTTYTRRLDVLLWAVQRV
ncbi:DUF2071 domain-containing protein [Paenibacillus sp. HN-1]|uniref:YqjF family protein n=1 Tax=Paenibacillus TaxID=44249 RepID=UPI001CA8D6AF|nr:MULTISPECIES: DUF2071 domain-containing protein [Paenibacillus]MBY9080260.1 DUF2071 domain-containing protein [Paenibacillus sp. CGMCC 1.18879]MBY9083081.1 DUF2071 domain-containing protein [Paenibacillus sinensis]